MSKLFVSFHYTAVENGQYHTGFDNVVIEGGGATEPTCEEDIQDIQTECNEYMVRNVGFDNVVSTIINWKLM